MVHSPIKGAIYRARERERFVSDDLFRISIPVPFPVPFPVPTFHIFHLPLCTLKPLLSLASHLHVQVIARGGDLSVIFQGFITYKPPLLPIVSRASPSPREGRVWSTSHHGFVSVCHNFLGVLTTNDAH